MPPERTCAYSKCGVKFTPQRNKKGPMYHSAKCRVYASREAKAKAKKKKP